MDLSAPGIYVVFNGAQLAFILARETQRVESYYDNSETVHLHKRLTAIRFGENKKRDISNCK